MGMHIGIIAARTSVASLQEAFFRIWNNYELFESSGLLKDANEMYDWKQSHEEFVSAADWRKDNPGKEVYGFWQDGPWAVILDHSYVNCADNENLAALSRQFGTVLSVAVESASGCAFFSLFENGALRRSVFNSDGEVEAKGAPLPNEAALGNSLFYMDEAERLLASFGLAGFEPSGGECRALCVIDRKDYSKSDPAHAANVPPERPHGGQPSQEARPADLGPQEYPAPGKKPWWKFW